MSTLPDLTSAMESFEKALMAGDIAVQKCALDPLLFVYADAPNGEPRMTYVRLDGKKVTALVSFLHDQPVDGERCFGVGWAVPEELRGEGRAPEAFKAALRELRHGLARHGIARFYVEAVVGVDNPASQRVAEKVISPALKTDTDKFAGVPVIQYLRKIDSSTVV